MHNQQAFSGAKVGAIVVAAGAGSRMASETPKQYLPLAGIPVIAWSVNALLAHPAIGAIAIVHGLSDHARVAALLPSDPRITLVEGGAARTDSVRNGLAAIAARTPSAVLIHDAARPGLSGAVINELLTALQTADAAAPALPVSDALKSATDGAVRSVPRDGLVRVQTPQAFRWAVISAAYASATSSAVDDLALVEAAGAHIALTPGRAELLKITYPEDLAVAEKLIAAPTVRIGTGFDVHGFEPGDAVILCGVRIPHTKKLEGHSDADAGWHALTDAILGAAALGDIGDHFPPSDPQWKGASSLVFLQHAAKLAANLGYRIANADITILAERPKISPHREAMRAATAQALAIPLDAVSIKATTTEKLGFVGREEGIAAQASVLLTR